MIDFAPIAVAAPVLTAPLIEVSGAVYFLASAVVVGLFLFWLDRRVAGVSVLLDDDQMHVRNVFRSYRLPNASVKRVVSRHAWIGSLYASCLGVHTSATIVRIPGRSIALHALGPQWDEEELAQLVRSRMSQ